MKTVLTMKQNEAIKQYLVSAGWMYKGSCNCGGMPTYKYEAHSEEGGEYKLRVRARNFSISKPGERLTKFPITELKQMVDEVSRGIKKSVSQKTQDKIVSK